MDAYDIQQQLKAAWSTIVMQQTQTGELNKRWPHVPVYVITEEGKELPVLDFKLQENRIYLCLSNSGEK